MPTVAFDCADDGCGGCDDVLVVVSGVGVAAPAGAAVVAVERNWFTWFCN